MTTTICYWLDSTSDPTDPKWIVSRDELDKQGRAEHTRTLSVHDDRDSAEAEAQRVAAGSGLPCVCND